MGSVPDAVTIYEVGPRDGLQNQPATIPTSVKIAFVDLLSEAGFGSIEVSAFVRPGMIPQLSDAEEVFAGIRRRAGTRYVALVPNERGLERAAASSPDGVAFFTAASETFSRANTNASIDQSLGRFRPVAALCRAKGTWLRAYISTVFGCPYEGPVSINAVIRVVGELDALGADQIVLSDTIGVATPVQVADVVSAVSRQVDVDRLALHFHDTRGTALANVLAGLQCGVATYDSSAGGLGGCPFAPGAAGNVATEDLIFMLNGMNIDSGVSLDGVVRASRFLMEQTGYVPTSRYFHAGTP